MTQPPPAAFSVRPFVEGDENAAAQLFEEVFGKRCTPDQYRWKLLESPCPKPGAPAWFADHDGAIVGQFAGRAIRFKLGEEIVTGVHGCDVMTRSDRRRQGILGATGKAAFHAWGEGGARFVFGLQNDNWGSRNRYLGLEPQFKLGQYWRPVCAGALARRWGTPRWLASPMDRVWTLMTARGLPGPAESVEVRGIDAPGSEFDQLWQELGDRFEATVVRDRAWLAYRYSTASGQVYRLLLASRAGHPSGYLVYREPTREDGTAVIADVFTAPGDTYSRKALIRAALDELATLGAQSVRAHHPPRTPLAKELTRSGFVPRPGRYAVVVIPLGGHPVAVQVRDPNRWFLSAGDFDIV